MYQKCHFEQKYTRWQVALTKLFSLAQYDKMYNLLFTPKKPIASTILFKQTYAQNDILSREVFYDMLTFP